MLLNTEGEGKHLQYYFWENTDSIGTNEIYELQKGICIVKFRSSYRIITTPKMYTGLRMSM